MNLIKRLLGLKRDHLPPDVADLKVKSDATLRRVDRVLSAKPDPVGQDFATMERNIRFPRPHR